MPDQDVFTLPTDEADAEPAKRAKGAKKPEPEPIDARLVDAARAAGSDEPEAKADEAPAPEAPKGPQPPHPAARLVQTQWLVKRRGKTFIARPAIVNNKPAPSSLYDLREFDAILDPATPICDEPGRLEAAFQAADCRMTEVRLYDDGPVELEIARLRDMGLDAMADLLREKHPQAAREPYGPLDLGTVQASTNIHKLGPGPARGDLRPFLRRHAQGDYGDRGKLAEVEFDDDKREFPGAFGGAVMNAVSLERGWGLVWSTYSGAEIVAEPEWRDSRRLHIATILGSSRTYVWAAPFDGISTN